jgi:hypothetical protein
MRMDIPVSRELIDGRTGTWDGITGESNLGRVALRSGFTGGRKGKLRPCAI